MKRLFALSLAMLLCFTFPSCGQTEYSYPEEKLGGIQTSQGKIYPEPFITFDKTEVSFDMFRYYYLNYRDEYLKEDKDHFKAEGAEDAMKEEVLSCLLDYYAVLFLAKEYKVKLSDEEMDAVREDIQKTIDFYGEEEEFLSVIHESHMSHGLYYKMMEYSSLYLKLFNTLYEDGGKEAWSDEEFYEYYRKNYLALQQIYIPFETGETETNHTETLAKANDVYNKAADGADFWKLIEAHGKDETMLDYPDGFYITKGEAEDALYEAANKLAIGEISKPVVGKSGLYIIKRLELKELRMKENRSTALFGYYDTTDTWHAGAYDSAFQELYRKRAEKIKVDYGTYWDQISSETVY